MKIFADRLNRLMFEQNLSDGDMADLIGDVDRKTIMRYRHDETEPKISRLIDVAEALDTSPAYLLGLTDKEGEE